jgi:dTDP-glucose 4,6-dehydratase
LTRHILVTGGAGFIGSNFVRYVQGEFPDIEITNLDLLTYAGSQENLRNLPNPDKHCFIRGDIGNQELVENILREKNIDTIVHFAAESHVDRSLMGPAAFMQTNIMGTFSLLEAARKVWLNEKHLDQDESRFHHISTDEVFGSLGVGEPAFSETTPYAPNSPYAASKASSDHLVRAYGHSFGLPFTISNCSNNYGPYQFPEKLVPLMITNALAGKPLPVYGDGMQVRDWLYVADHCEAIWKIIESGNPGESYNIGGNNQPANIEIVRTICILLNQAGVSSPVQPHEKLIQHVPDRPGHDRRYAMDITRIQSELSWQPHYNLEEGLRATIDWYLSNPNWLETIGKQAEYQDWVNTNYQKRGNE